MTLTIQPSEDPVALELAKFEVNRPCYLVDLQGVDVLDCNKGRIQLEDPAYFAIKWTPDMEGKDPRPEGEPFSEDNCKPLSEMWVGHVHQWYIRGPKHGHNDGTEFEYDERDMPSGLALHPFHVHINHYQITGLAETDEYFQVGDWHDTFLHS